MIETKGLTKRFGELTALDSLSLDIGPGEIFGFIGPNGAGKSTTMKILACLMKPDSGLAKVAGLDTSKDPEKIRRMIGYMPDFLGVYDDLTVEEYLNFFAAAFEVPRRERAKVVDGVLSLTDLQQKKKAMVDSLSRGMQQRLGVARVLIHEPKVLLLDEPASGLDPRARIEMRSLLQELGRMGSTLMVSSHILSELAEMCTSIGIIERGRLLYAGSVKDAYARTRKLSNAGERIEVRFEAGGAGVEAAIAAFADEPRVAKVERLDAARAGVESGDKAEGDAAVEVATPDAPNLPGVVIELKPEVHEHHFVLERLIRAGVRIARFEPQTIKLEDAFLKLTTGALQ